MRIASCPHCGQREPALDGKSTTITCPRCRNVTQLLAASDFLKKANELWPGCEVTLRSARVARAIEKHDAYLKRRGDYDIITATLNDNHDNNNNKNWPGEGLDDDGIDGGGSSEL